MPSWVPTSPRLRRLPEAPPSVPPADVLATSAVLRRLELEVTRRLDGLVSGDHLSAATGPGSERAGARAYSPGDDARRIDWNLTARSLEPHVRTTEADRELETTVVVDRSASLDFGTARREKREVVLAVLAAFGVLTVRGGNRVGVVVAGNEALQPLPTRASRAGLLAALATVHETPRRDSPPGAGADLAAALRWVDRTRRRRGLVVVASDLLDGGDWAGELRRLALRHQVVVVQVSDPRELSLPAVGMLTLVDAESGRRVDVQTGSTALRERYAVAAGGRQERLRRAVVDAGAEHLHLSTDEDWVLALARFVARRRPEVRR